MLVSHNVSTHKAVLQTISLSDLLGGVPTFLPRPYHFRISGKDFEKFGKAILKFQKSRVLPIMIAWVVGWGGVSKTQKDATGVGHTIMQGGAAIPSMVPLFLFMVK